MTFQKALTKLSRIEQQIRQIQKDLKPLPDGKLICCQGNNCFKWYQSNGHTKKYIPKRNRNLAEQLAIKKYLTCLLQELEQEKLALEFYLRHCAKAASTSHQLLTEHTGYQELLAPYFSPRSRKHQKWMNEPYEKNPHHPEHLIHKTSSGIMVRSKSEAMIERFLHTNQIPFRYECALNLSGSTVYPDFTILHPKTSDLFYWEHFGRMDDPSYVRKTTSKLHLYLTNGIIPSIRLITTYETPEHPISYEDIVAIATHYFL